MKPFAIMGAAIFGAIAISTAFPAVAQKRAVTTYHYDNYRTGWNPAGNKADPGKCRTDIIWRDRPGRARRASRCATPSRSRPTDYRRISVGPTGTYQVVYVATEGNTIYGIRASNGTVLLRETSELRFPRVHATVVLTRR